MPVRVALMLVSGSDSKTRRHTFARIARLASDDVADELCAANSSPHATNAATTSVPTPSMRVMQVVLRLANLANVHRARCG